MTLTYIYANGDRTTVPFTRNDVPVRDRRIARKIVRAVRKVTRRLPAPPVVRVTFR